jgi:hypothetical protein
LKLALALEFRSHQLGEYCSEINGINENNSGILSLTSMQNVKVALFVNNVNINIAD